MWSLDSGIGVAEFAAGMQTYYNYIRPHQEIGGIVPVQMAGISLDLTGNRWMKIIEMPMKRNKYFYIITLEITS
jgi:hypothetical protein